MTEKQSFDFKTSKTARYFTLGNSTKANCIILALHGYGQLPSYFLNKFEGISPEYFVVAPEGLHRFYLNGTSGRVGASWMTKEARESDLNDTSYYLKQLITELTNKYQIKKIILLGFSQGGATAARLYSDLPMAFDQLILWASVFPPDIDTSKELCFSKSKKSPYFVLGEKDEFFHGDIKDKMIAAYVLKGFKTVLFDGAHTIDLSILNEVLFASQNN